MALCGTSKHALLWMLEQNEHLNNVILCMDHDETGIEVTGRLAETLHEAGYCNVSMLQPVNKDWNEDLKARHGVEAQPAIEHPQLKVVPGICRRIGKLSEGIKLDNVHLELPSLLEKFRSNLHWGNFDRAMECMERMSALSLAACGRELRQIGQPATSEELSEALRRRIRPHQNRGVIKNRYGEIGSEIQSVLARGRAEGIRTEADKRQLADAWLDLAASCAKVTVKYEADLVKETQKQEQASEQEAEPEQSTHTACSAMQMAM